MGNYIKWAAGGTAALGVFLLAVSFAKAKGASASKAKIPANIQPGDRFTASSWDGVHTYVALERPDLQRGTVRALKSDGGMPANVSLAAILTLL